MRTGAKLNRAALPSTCSITAAYWQVHNRHHNAGKQEQGDHARDQNWKQMKGCTPAPTKAGRAPPTRRNYRQKSSGRSARPPEKSRYNYMGHQQEDGYQQEKIPQQRPQVGAVQSPRRRNAVTAVASIA